MVGTGLVRDYFAVYGAHLAAHKVEPLTWRAKKFDAARRRGYDGVGRETRYSALFVAVRRHVRKRNAVTV